MIDLHRLIYRVALPWVTVGLWIAIVVVRPAVLTILSAVLVAAFAVRTSAT